jgi:hypothetical protein
VQCSGVHVHFLPLLVLISYSFRYLLWTLILLFIHLVLHCTLVVFLLFSYYFLHRHLLYLPSYSLIYATLIANLVLFDYKYFKANVGMERFSNALNSFTVFLF